MVGHFGYMGMKDGKAVIHTGGLSTLSNAFKVLSIPDPCPLELFKKFDDEVQKCQM